MTKKTKFPSVNSSLEQGKVPPNAVDLEEVVLGGIMLESDVMAIISAILTPEMFYKLEHQQVYAAMLDLYDTASPIDILTVTSKLKQNGNLDMVGGPYFVSQLTEDVASSANAEYHARIIVQKFIQRELIRVSGDVYHEAFEDTTDPLDLLEKANENFSQIGSETVGVKVMSNKDAIKEVFSASERAAKGGNVVGIPSGIHALDLITGGAQAGQFNVLAARVAMGKTTLALWEAYQAAVVLKKNVLFLSLEMTSTELMRKLLSIHTEIDAKLILRGALDKSQWDTINSKVQELIDSNITIIDGMSDWNRIRTECVNRNKRKKIDIVFIDYLQLMSISNWKGNREGEVATISRGVKSLAKQIEAPIRALAQLSRAVETRGGTKRPMLSDLRESGAIEADADSVTFLYRPEYYGVETSEEFGISTQGLCEAIVAKNRGGNTGTAPMHVNLAISTFKDWEENSFAPTPPMDSDQGYPIKSMPRSSEFGVDDEDPF